MKKSPLVATATMAGARALCGCAAPLASNGYEDVQTPASDALKNHFAVHLDGIADVLDGAADVLDGAVDVLDDVHLVIRLLAVFVRAIAAVRGSLRTKRSPSPRKLQQR